MRTTWCLEERCSPNIQKCIPFYFCCSQERLKCTTFTLLSSVQHRKSELQYFCDFCSISYKGYCILHWKILKSLSHRETSVYLWYSHIKGSYFFLKVRILHLWLYLNKQNFKGGEVGGGAEGESNLWLDKYSCLALWYYTSQRRNADLQATVLQ